MPPLRMQLCAKGATTCASLDISMLYSPDVTREEGLPLGTVLKRVVNLKEL